MIWYALLAVAVVLTTAGNILLRLGMERVGRVRPSELWAAVGRGAREPRLWAGVACLAGFLACYALALTRLDVSLANPLTAGSILLSTAYAALFMKENVTSRRWLGVALVTLGVVLVTLQGLPGPEELQGLLRLSR